MKRLSVAEAAAEWGVHVDTVRLWVEENDPPPGYICKIMRGKKRNTYYIWDVRGEKK